MQLLGNSERDRLLQAAAEIYAEHGYEAMEVEEILRRSGVSRPVFEQLLGGKEQAVLAAVDVALVGVVEVVAGFYSPDRAEVESYAGAIGAILDLMSSEPAFAHLTYIGSRQQGPPGVKARFDTGIAFLTAMLERLWDYSPDASPPPSAARAALGGAEAVVRREVARGRTEKLPRLLPDFVYTATVPFLGQREALRLAQQSRDLFRDGEGVDR